MESSPDYLQQVLQLVADAVGAVLFFPVLGFPLIVLWLMATSIYFTLYLRGVNFRLFRHALDVARGKFDTGQEAGEISPIKALFSAIAATVGLGSIAGVSVAVAAGGPGAIFWIVVGGVLGMASKFAEVTLSMCYRTIDADGKVMGGGFYYIREGLRERGLDWLGKALAVLFAIFCLGGAIGGGNMFQSNQAVSLLAGVFPENDYTKPLLALALAGLVGLVLMGSIKRVAQVANVISPLKGVLYLICALIILAVNAENLGATFALIFSEAFSGSAVAGGFFGMLAIAFQRASFANEAGVGSAPIAHAAAKTNEPVREGAAALLEPLFAAGVGLLTGLIVVVTGAYAGADASTGVLIAEKAFATVGSWFTYLLVVNVLIFAYSTMIGWSYYGEIAWRYLFGGKSIKLFILIYAGAVFTGGVANFGVVMDLADLFILGMAIPNVIALVLLRKRIKAELLSYSARVLNKHY
jgi:AGCS family alanine or glycine:cation symporter